MPKIPIFITAQQIADAIDWRRQRVIRVMRKMGIARKRGKEIVVNAADFAGVWPDEFEVILEKLAEVPKATHGHIGRKRPDVSARNRERRNVGRTQVPTCEYEVGAGWSCRWTGCDNPDHRLAQDDK